MEAKGKKVHDRRDDDDSLIRDSGQVKDNVQDVALHASRYIEERLYNHVVPEYMI